VADLASLEQRLLVAKRAIASIPEAKLDPSAIDRKPGSTLNVLFAGAAAMTEEVERRAMAKFAALTLAGANGPELDALAAERTYGLVTRFGASPSVVPVRLSRAAVGLLPTGTVPAGTLLSAGAVQFALDADETFLLGQLGPLETTATATSAGAVTSVQAGAIAAFADASKLFDPRLAVTNPEPSAGGADAEEDDPLRARIRAFPNAVRRGTLAAIEFGALLVPGVTKAVAVEVLDLSGLQTGLVLLYVADANGQANAALVNKVRLALREWRAGGIAVRVAGAVPTFIDVALAIGFLDGYATPGVQSQARAAVVDAVNRLAPNEPLLRSTIVAALRTIPGVVVFDSSIVKPIGDLFPTPGQVFRTTPAQVTFA
jgi:uncharacterized phage protein gp47/JayE